jgi:hypothetical protein
MGLVNFSLNDIGSIVKDIRESITGEAIKDPLKLKELDIKLKELENRLLISQMEINKAEAYHKSLFVAGARPFLLWIGGFAIAYHFIVAPFLHSTFAIYDIFFPLPKLDMGLLMNLVMAILGIAGLRTYEKAKGIHNNPAN